jgi:hypothetical protein
MPILGLLLAMIGAPLYFSLFGIAAVEFHIFAGPALMWIFFIFTMLSMTVISFYISATLNEVRGRPLYIVANIITSENASLSDLAPQTKSEILGRG